MVLSISALYYSPNHSARLRTGGPHPPRIWIPIWAGKPAAPNCAGAKAAGNGAPSSGRVKAFSEH